MIRIHVRRRGADGKPTYTVCRLDGDSVAAAGEILARDRVFADPDVSEVIVQRLPDGPDVWPLPGYDQGMHEGERSTEDYYARNPDAIRVHPESDTPGHWVWVDDVPGPAPVPTR